MVNTDGLSEMLTLLNARRKEVRREKEKEKEAPPRGWTRRRPRGPRYAWTGEVSRLFWKQADPRVHPRSKGLERLIEIIGEDRGRVRDELERLA